MMAAESTLSTTTISFQSSTARAFVPCARLHLQTVRLVVQTFTHKWFRTCLKIHVSSSVLLAGLGALATNVISAFSHVKNAFTQMTCVLSATPHQILLTRTWFLLRVLTSAP